MRLLWYGRFIFEAPNVPQSKGVLVDLFVDAFSVLFDFVKTKSWCSPMRLTILVEGVHPDARLPTTFSISLAHLLCALLLSNTTLLKKNVFFFRHSFNVIYNWQTSISEWRTLEFWSKVNCIRMQSNICKLASGKNRSDCNNTKIEIRYPSNLCKKIHSWINWMTMIIYLPMIHLVCN